MEGGGQRLINKEQQGRGELQITKQSHKSVTFQALPMDRAGPYDDRRDMPSPKWTSRTGYSKRGKPQAGAEPCSDRR